MHRLLFCLIAVLALPAGAEDPLPAFRTVPPAAAAVVLPDFAVSGLRAVHLREERDGSVVTVGRWFPAQGLRPRAETVHARADRGYAFPTPPTPRRLAGMFDFLKAHRFAPAGERTAPTPYGAVPYLRLSSAQGDCVTFARRWSGGDIGGGAQLNGYFCAAPGVRLDDAGIARLLGGIVLRDPLPVDVTLEPGPRGLPVALDWNGRAGRGTLHPEGDGGGTLIVIMEGDGRCEGDWRHRGGGYGTPEPPHGEWRLLCAGGPGARGRYASPGPHRATGYGSDDTGAPVRLTVGGAP